MIYTDIVLTTASYITTTKMNYIYIVLITTTTKIKYIYIVLLQIDTTGHFLGNMVEIHTCQYN